MSLEISTKIESAKAILKASGQINISNTSEFEKELSPLLKYNDKDIIIDFTELDYISSAGMRILIMNAKKLAHDNKKFVCLLNPESKVKDIFYISGLYFVLNVEEVNK